MRTIDDGNLRMGDVGGVAHEVRDEPVSFDDRPPTRGEELKAACRAYSDHRSSSNLDELRIACTAPGLSRYFEQLV